MTWSLITIPAAEELSTGYVGTPAERETSDTGEALRRFIINLFAAFGLIAAIQSVATEIGEAGQRRLAESHIADRKSSCRGCDQQLLFTLNTEGTPDAPSPAAPVH